MSRGRFWGSALAVAAVFALLSFFLFPYGALDLETDRERHRAWLLTLWTAGVMAICFGGAGLISVVTPPGFRDVVEAGSTEAAHKARRDRTLGVYNFAGWTVLTGLLLLIIYFLAWLFGGQTA